MLPYSKPSFEDHSIISLKILFLIRIFLAMYTVKKKRWFWLSLVTSVIYLFRTIEYSGVPLPALHSNSNYIL